MTKPPRVLARIGIDPEALLNHAGQDRHSLNTQERLLEVLREYGVLEIMGTPDAKALLDAIEQLSPILRERWTASLVALHGCNRVSVGNLPQTMGDIARTHPLPQELGQSLDLFVLGKDAAVGQAVPERSGYWRRPEEPEFAVADSADVCLTIKEIRTMHKLGNFPERTSRKEIWDRLIAPLAALSDEVTILDRFFLTKYLRTKNLSKDPYVGHVKWLIESLGRGLLPGSTIRILGEWPEVNTSGRLEPLPESQVRDRAGERLTPLVRSGQVKGIRVVLAKAWAGNRRGAHNRHLRFSCGIAVTTHEGFDRLRDPAINGVDGFTWTLVSSSDRLADLGRAESTVTHHDVRLEMRFPASPA